MSVESITLFSKLFRGSVHLPAQLDSLRSAYQGAAPFPHVVLDGLFSPDMVDPLPGEMADLRAEQWRLVEAHSRERVWRMRSSVELGAAGTQLVSLVHSAPFLHLLSEITGIGQLLPDPYLQGAGYASMRPGDYFNVHTDRNVAYETGLTRRLAMIVFLNQAWESRYNGQLELWNSDATRCDVSIEPIHNRTVIFEVAEPNYHGVPNPIACPDGRSRQSFIVYYHTVGIDGKLTTSPRSSVFAPNLQRTDSKLRILARELTPPLLLKAARSLVKRRKTV